MNKCEVLCVGNAIVDMIAACEDDFLPANDIVKGSMNLVKMERAAHLQAAMKTSGTRMSGGSAGNTASAIGVLGGRVAFIGKVAADDDGDFYREDIRSCGVSFETKSLAPPPGTACSMIFVTPDGQRSMNTYLGACMHLGLEDLPEGNIPEAGIVFFEGYLWDTTSARGLVRALASRARQSSSRVAMTLSDSFCVDRHRQEFLHMLKSGTVDMVFANSREIKSLYQTSSLEKALETASQDCPLVIVTRSEKGSVILYDDDLLFIEASEVPEIIDTTGAGDLYAAGFLFGLTRGYDLKTCGCIGSFLAGVIISRVGARLSHDIRTSLCEAGFLTSIYPQQGESA